MSEPIQARSFSSRTRRLGVRQELSYRRLKPDAQAKDVVQRILRLRAGFDR